jgi:type II secretory pathway component GspD/PulD (secretin)
MTLSPLHSRLLVTFTAASLLAGLNPAARAQASAAPRPFTMSFHNADAADVLRAFSLQSGLSLAVSPSVKGKLISIRLKNVTPEEALRLITQAAGVTYRRAKGAYLVGSEDELKKIRSTDSFASYPLKHLTPTAARSILEGTLPYVLAQGTDASGSLTLTGSLDDVRAAQRLLSLADVPTAPTTEVVTPEHVPAAFLGDILRRAEPGVTVTLQENALILTGSREAVARAKAMVPSADTVNGSAQRVEIYRIRYSSAASLGSMLSAALPNLLVTPSAEPFAPAPARFQPLTGGSLGSGSFSTGGGVGAAIANGAGLGSAGAGGVGPGAGGVSLAGIGAATSITKSRQLILSGPDAQVDQALRLLKAVDVAPAQVSIEARIMDITNADTLDLGVQWGSLQAAAGAGGGGGGGGAGAGMIETFTQGATQNKVSEQNVPDFIRFGRFARSPLNFAAQLQFLQTQNRAKTLANPRISVVDNEDANIFIGDVLRFQVLAITSATTGNAFTVQEVPVGIALLVRPRVNDNGEITIKVHPVVSTLTSLVQGLPQTAAREADTTLRVRDGDTIAIGGLIRDQDIRTVQEVPILARIPIFGELFRNRSNQKQRSEVVIFLTIRLLKDGETAEPMTGATSGSASAPSAPKEAK